MWFATTDASLNFYDFGTSRNRLVHINMIKHVPLWTQKLQDPSFPINISLEAVVCWSLDGCKELGDGRRTPARTACRHPVSKVRGSPSVLSRWASPCGPNILGVSVGLCSSWTSNRCRHTLGTFLYLAFPVHVKSVKFVRIISLFHITAIPVIIARYYYCLTISKYMCLFNYWCKPNSLIFLAFSWWHIFSWT